MSSWSIKKIVFATDFSEESRPALVHALNLARLLDAAVDVIHVREPFPYAPVAGVGGFVYPIDDLRTWVEKEMAKVVVEVAATGLPYRASVVEGNAAKQIVKHAKDVGADFIVIATHGRTGIDHALLGSVAEKVVRSSACPVMVVPTRQG
jgi:nucleotide-binding universal stress UspA family protein